MTWKKVRRTSIRRIQRYQHNYCLLSLTGCLGCRWKRYQQSRKSYTPCDHLWSAILLLTFCVCSLFFFHWLSAANEQAKLNYVLFSWLHYWVNWYYVVRSVTCAIYTYLCFLLILSFLHMCIGYQLYIHHVHRTALVLILVLCIVEWALFWEMAAEFWSLFAIAIKIFGPYIQLSFVFVFTVASWLVAGLVWRDDRTAWRVSLLTVFACVMTIVYLAPLMSSYPCVCSRNQLPQKPKLIAHRGASALAPENTKAAFDLAIQYNASVLEVDVSVSADGQLYAFHDRRLTRTTDIAKIFPDNITMNFWEFTSDQIDELQTGEWFIKFDPYGTASSLSHQTQQVYARQTIPRLDAVLKLVKENNVSLLLNVKPWPGRLPDDHQYKNTYRDLLIEKINKSAIPHGKIYWMESLNSSLPAPVGTIPVMYGSGFSTSQLGEWNIETLNTNYTQTGEETLRMYRHHDIDVFVHVINADWLFSYFWCVGVAAVSSDRVHRFASLNEPVYIWDPRSYLMLWILSDCISAALITVIFIAQYFRHSGGRFIPDVSMSMSRRGPMKEKLLYVVDRTSPEMGIDHRIEIRERNVHNGGDANGDSGDGVSVDHSVLSSTIDRKNSLNANNDTSLSDISIIVDKY